MIRFRNLWVTSRQMRKGWGIPFHWGGGELFVAAILIVGILSLGSGMFGSWITGAKEGGLLPVSLHSLGEADYSVDKITRPVPAIGLEIIQDLLGIEEPPETGGMPEIAMITASDPSPTSTPTLPFNGEIPLTATPTANNLDNATATKGPKPSATPFLTAPAIPTTTSTTRPLDTPIPTATINPPDTPMPTSTPGISATRTPMPTQMLPTATAPIPGTSKPSPSPLPPPTNTANPSPTPLPDNSATPRPTRSSTLAATVQYTHTPAVTAGIPSLP